MNQGYVTKQEHRTLMELHLKRKLRDNEVVHHINRIRNDNRIENLQVMTKKQHARIHAKDKRKPRIPIARRDSFTFRLPGDMGQMIRSRADENHRSFSREILWLLHNGLKHDPEGPKAVEAPKRKAKSA